MQNLSFKSTFRFVAIALTLSVGGVQAADRPVVLELFTSQSCSSCPPAEALIHQLRSTQPIAGVKLIALSEHVDYWDQLGWRDPYSSQQYTRRQQQYAAQVFRSSEVYTPQLVVDGYEQAVGSDTSAVMAAIHSAALAQTLPVTVSARRSGDEVTVDVSVKGSNSSDAAIWLALTENGIATHVGGGENGGRTLHEDGIVRVLQRVGSLDDNGGFAKRVSLPLKNVDTKISSLRVVAFVQTNSDHRIAGAAESSIE